MGSPVRTQSQRNGTCKLCLEEKEIQNSHLIPRSLYLPLRDKEDPNPNPILLTSAVQVKKSAQVTDYLLCKDCELLLSRNGEDWVARHAFNARTFLLRDILNASTPLSIEEDPNSFRVYSTVDDPRIDMDKLVYFAASVFWRASVHEWKMLDITIQNPLGEYEEPFRRFLLGGEFPVDAALHVTVSPFATPWRSILVSPPRVSDEGHTDYSFWIPGMYFRLIVGNVHLTDREMCAYRSPRKYIYMSHAVDFALGQMTLSTWLYQQGLSDKYYVKAVF